MSDALSPVLALPLLQPSQAQKHITHNEALRLLEIVVQASVTSRSLSAPPLAPAEGARYLVAAGANGAWEGQAGKIAAFQGGDWIFLPPQPGWQLWVEDEALRLCRSGAGWQAESERAAGFASLGVNTGADATNRLSVSSAATLLSHDGAGHQLKLNKAAAAETASLLFQTGWSGRAEIGTTGSDLFALKTSADGSTWVTALSVAADGLLSGQAVTQDAQDTSPGRLMRTHDFGLGHAIALGLGDDLDALEAGGFYHLAAAAEALGIGAPLASAGAVVQITDGSPAGRIQLFLSRPEAALYLRHALGDGSFAPWTCLTPESETLPAGRVLRLADGTQITTQEVDLGPVLALGAGSFADPYRTAPSDILFPEAFLAPPTVSFSCPATSPAGAADRALLPAGFGVAADKITGLSIARVAGGGAAGDVRVMVTALGRWR